jgi:hypothetical protein
MSLTKHCKEEVAVWRTGACAGEFGDAFIKDTNLEGEETHYALLLERQRLTAKSCCRWILHGRVGSAAPHH